MSRYMVRIDCASMGEDESDRYCNDDAEALSLDIELLGWDSETVDRWIVPAARPSLARKIVQRLTASYPHADIVSVTRVAP